MRLMMSWYMRIVCPLHIERHQLPPPSHRMTPAKTPPGDDNANICAVTKLTTAVSLTSRTIISNSSSHTTRKSTFAITKTLVIATHNPALSRDLRPEPSGPSKPSGGGPASQREHPCTCMWSDVLADIDIDNIKKHVDALIYDHWVCLISTPCDSLLLCDTLIVCDNLILCDDWYCLILVFWYLILIFVWIRKSTREPAAWQWHTAPTQPCTPEELLHEVLQRTWCHDIELTPMQIAHAQIHIESFVINQYTHKHILNRPWYFS